MNIENNPYPNENIGETIIPPKAPGKTLLKIIGIIYIILGALMIAGLFSEGAITEFGIMAILYAGLRLIVGIYGVAKCGDLAKADTLQAWAVFNLFLTVSWRGSGVFAVIIMIILSVLFLVGATKNCRAYGRLQRQ